LRVCALKFSMSHLHLVIGGRGGCAQTRKLERDSGPWKKERLEEEGKAYRLEL